MLFMHKNPSREWSPDPAERPYPLRNAGCDSAEYVRGDGRARLYSLASSTGWESELDTPGKESAMTNNKSASIQISTPKSAAVSPRWREHLLDDKEALEERGRKNELRFPSPPPLPPLPPIPARTAATGGRCGAAGIGLVSPRVTGTVAGRTLMGRPKKEERDRLRRVKEEEVSMEMVMEARGMKGTFGSVGAVSSPDTKTFGSSSQIDEESA
jgi:hypothetical protein